MQRAQTQSKPSVGGPPGDSAMTARQRIYQQALEQKKRQSERNDMTLASNGSHSQPLATPSSAPAAAGRAQQTPARAKPGDGEAKAGE